MLEMQTYSNWKITKSPKMFGDTYEYRTSLSKFMSQHINKKARNLIKKNM